MCGKDSLRSNEKRGDGISDLSLLPHQEPAIWPPGWQQGMKVDFPTLPWDLADLGNTNDTRWYSQMSKLSLSEDMARRTLDDSSR